MEAQQLKCDYLKIIALKHHKFPVYQAIKHRMGCYADI